MDAKPLRILVVEPHEDTRVVLVSFLTSLGHWVESCRDAETALERMDHDGLDMLLTDAWLVSGRGWDYLKTLKKQGKLPRRVVSMSAGENDAERKQSQAHGCSAHLVKPILLSELEAALQ